MDKGKYLGIDFGDRRVGLAISDLNKEIAFPRDFLLYKKIDQLIKEIKSLCEEEGVIKIVIGLPIQMDGTFGERVIKTQKFGQKIKEIIPGVDVEYFDERLTTQIATQLLHEQGIKAKDHKDKNDAISAHLILQAYLDSLNND